MTDPLRAQLDAYADEFPEAPGWDDVVRRARGPRRRVAGLGAIAAAAVLVPSALAFPALRHVFDGTPAPVPVVSAFRAGNRISGQLPATTRSNSAFRLVDPSTAHGVLSVSTASGPLYLWAAREQGGRGQCWFVAWHSELRLALAFPTDPGCDTAKPAAAIAYRYAWSVPHWATALLVGRVYPAAATVTVTFGCGQHRTVPVVEGLFLTTFLYGTRVSSLTARDGNGRVTAVRQVPWRPSPGAPPGPNGGVSCRAAASMPRVLSRTVAEPRSHVVAVALTYWPSANPPGRIVAAAKRLHLQARWHIPLAFVDSPGTMAGRFPPSVRGRGCRRGIVLQVWFQARTTRVYGPCGNWPAAVQPLGQAMTDQLGRFELRSGQIHPPG